MSYASDALIDALKRENNQLQAENAKLKQELEAVGTAAYLYGRTDLADENAKLRKEVEQWHRLTAGIELPDYPITEFKPKDLERENAKLREQTELLVTLLRNDCDIEASWDGLRHFWSIGLTENGCLMRDRACKAEAENAKLRALVESYGMIANEAVCDYYDRDDMLADANATASELGIEVGV